METYLRLRSPAEAGPLASLDRWFEGFAPTLLRGLDTATINRAVAASLAVPALAVPAFAGGTVAGGGPTIVVTGNTILGSEREPARQLALLVDPHLQQQTGIPFYR